MTVTRNVTRAEWHPNKRERVARHIEDLKRQIKARYPEAQFDVAPVPEYRWPGLWVRCDADEGYDVREPLQDIQDAFFGRENVYVNVIFEGRPVD
jgi:hypothetical protein